MPLSLHNGTEGQEWTELKFKVRNKIWHYKEQTPDQD